jgi:L-rhamnose mutarotase
MKRFGQIIGIKPDRVEVYKQLHEAVWPAVLNKIKECNIRNYSIYLYDNLLFAYFEYVGNDFEADMAKMAADPMTQMVGHLYAYASAGRGSQARRTLAHHGGGISYGLMPMQPRNGRTGIS